MDRRQDPLPQDSAAEKESRLQAVLNWLGEPWVRDTAVVHPVRELWQRRDFLASTELLSIGMALNKLQASQPPAQMQELADRVRSFDSGTRAGAIFETMAAAMFEHNGQRVRLAEPNEPGFDLSILFPNGHEVRVSCKALGMSYREEYFSKMMGAVHAQLLAQLRNRQVFAKLVLSDPEDAGWQYPADLAEALLNGRPEPQRWRGWNYVLAPLVHDPTSGATFAPNELSYTFVGLSPVAPNEQKRLNDRIEDALSGFAAHCADVSATKTNVAVVKVPPSASLATAVDWLNARWAAGDLQDVATAAVLLYRAQATTIREGASSVVTHEFAMAENPHAARSLHSIAAFPWALEVPIGAVSTEETVPLLSDGANVYSTAGYYMFLRGSHVYAADVAGGNVSFKASRRSYTSITLLVSGLGGGDLRLSFVYPPGDNLLLI